MQGAWWGCSGILKKQSLMSMLASGQCLGNMAGEGIPDCKRLNSSITSFTLRKSWRSFHLFFPSFLITKTGVFHGLFVRMICPLESCF